MHLFRVFRPAVGMFIAAAVITAFLPACKSGAVVARSASPPGARAGSAGMEKMKGAEYVGAETCSGCHEELASEFSGTLHAKAGYWVSEFKECEACHGPGGNHVSSQDPAMIRNPAEMKRHEINELCLGCHHKGKLAHWDNGTHESMGLGCIDCHAVHGGNDVLLTKMTTKDVCFRCHGNIKALLYRSSHHPIREGKIDCTDCHNPHGTIAPRLIEANTINDKCYECHAEKRGPYLFEHRPVVEDCTICHTPHGSNHDKLLVRKNIYLCQSCHSNQFHPGDLYTEGNPANDGPTAFVSLDHRGVYRVCLNCHNNIHGSNHPSGARFLR